MTKFIVVGKTIQTADEAKFANERPFLTFRNGREDICVTDQRVFQFEEIRDRTVLIDAEGLRLPLGHYMSIQIDPDRTFAYGYRCWTRPCIHTHNAVRPE